MKKKYFLLILVLFSMLTQRVHAYCSSTELQKFKEIESSIKATKTYDEKTKLYTVVYYISDNNFANFAYKKSKLQCSYLSFNELKCTSSTDTFDENVLVIGISDTCDDVLKEKIITGKPKYNKYADSELCKGIEEFTLCQKNYDKEITQEEFESRVKTYKKTVKEKQLTDKKTEKNNQKTDSNKFTFSLNKIINLIKENYILAIASTIFVILIIITIILTYKKYKQSRWLE